MSRKLLACALLLTFLSNPCPLVAAESTEARTSTSPDRQPWPLDIYVSTGDNHWLAHSLPIDSPRSIDDTFKFLRDIGFRRVYWRGLEAATWVDSSVEREESPRYYEFWKWLRHLYKDVDPDQLAGKAAEKYGLEFWGVATLVDWGSQADVPAFADWPFNNESKLRLEHPEWVPVDRYGILRQGGPIDFSYPEARKALVDLHKKFMNRDHYVGMVFLTYAENHSMRFQDEFGFNEPVMKEFKKRYGIDPRIEDWTRFASREDWIRLRGEYLTTFVRELKAALDADGQKLGFVLDPHDLRFPQPWNVPELMRTAGSIYLDLETWVQEKLVSEFLVYGYCAPALQSQAVEDALWLTRDTPTRVGALTSSPLGERWKSLTDQGAFVVDSCSNELLILSRSSGLGSLPLSDLQNEKILYQQKVLAQIAEGETKATLPDIAPFLNSDNVITRRLALRALEKTRDPSAIQLAINALDDPETGVRGIAMETLGKIGDPGSAAAILQSIRKQPNHPSFEMAIVALQKLKPFPQPVILNALNDSDANVRMVATRSLIPLANSEMLPQLTKGLDDPFRYVRFASTEAMGKIRQDPKTVQALISATGHDDPMVSTRAATSLAQVLGRNEAVIAPLRPAIIEALQQLYLQYGNGSQRTDKEWGYRPVGNALLAGGPEGESFLQSLIDAEDSDPELASQAWKSLYIRKAPNSFSEVTEKENAEAFQRRPQVLKKSRTPVLKNAFDETSIYRPDVTGQAGDVSLMGGRWGAFTSAAPAISTERFLSPPQALKFSPGSASLLGHGKPVSEGANYTLTLSVWREPQATFLIKVKGNNGSYQDEFCLRVEPDGSVYLGEGTETSLELQIPESNWVPVRASVDPRRRVLKVKVGEENNEFVSPPDTVTRIGDVRAVQIVPRHVPDSGDFYVDDIELSESR